MKIHELKTWPSAFREVVSGSKRHEVRPADRDFAVGDVLSLLEWDPTPSTSRGAYPPRGYTGRRIDVCVTYVTHAGTWGLPLTHCVMSIQLLGPVLRRFDPPRGASRETSDHE
jgi:hypothetical protein